MTTHPLPRTAARRRAARPAAACAGIAAAGVAAALLVAVPAAADPTAVEPIRFSAPGAALDLTPVATHLDGAFEESAAEIVTFHAPTQQAFVVNARAGVVDVLSTATAGDLTKVATLDATAVPGVGAGAVANSVVVRADGLVVVAVENPVKTDAGWLVFFDATAHTALGSVPVGALPDMVTLTPDGTAAVVANEGEPADDYSIDPEGSIAVVALPATLTAPAAADVRTATFHANEADGTRELPAGVRVFGEQPHGADRPVSRNLEPEYVTVAADGRTAWVSLQEANALAVVDLEAAEVTDLLPLGTVDHSQVGSGIDPSDRDGRVDVRTVPVHGLPMPDSIASYSAAGETYIVTANEGDAREWGDYVEAERVKDLGKGGLAPICADSPAAGLRGDADLGRLEVTIASGLNADGTCYEQLHSFGTRSISIYSADGERVFDSGQLFEDVVAQAIPEFFNSNHATSDLESRSDAKGPEPEGVALGRIDGRTYAFVGFERVGGIAVLDVTVPAETSFVTYINNRDFSVSAGDAIEDGGDPARVLAAAGDLGPEGLAFIPAEGSPTGTPALLVGNEVSGTTTLYEIDAEIRFTDTAGNDFAEAIDWLARERISTGWVTADGTREYRPLLPIARDAMAAFLYRWAGSPAVELPGTSPFADVSTDDQFYREIVWMEQEGLATGWAEADGTATYRPLQPIARDAMAAFLHRAAGSPTVGLPASSPFVDVEPGAAFYDAIVWMQSTGIATGWEGNDGRDLYQPLQPVARDAMAAFLWRFDQRLGSPEVG
ncbi:choice-of-anchor I family protein [Serinibacter arcticus]|uniref:Alkaline phosphatase n=1 Tax=Serinibacter arcticus TaxID=1655435 RepID=A0A4Z1E4W8_9MICO|nr:choice-of-anchor I family protein [Serinibacter arcticus]TGO05513.1 Alkaline phosphatase [Serinibacter arcticus]